MPESYHGGDRALAGLAGYGISEVFTLSGGHVFPVYDACKRAGWRILDVRHEQTATFGAEGMAKLTRRPGVAVLTAGPGVTNGVSAVTTAYFNGSPLVVLGGRAPEGRWGAGSLQELDHVPILEPVTKSATTVRSLPEVSTAVAAAVETSMTPHRGPVFLDFPMDVLFAQVPSSGPGEEELPGSGTRVAPPRGVDPDPDEVRKAARLLVGSRRPAIVAGSDVWWAGAWGELLNLVETVCVPTFLNGSGRGCLPADHELCFSRARGLLSEADLVVVVGTPLDFRLSFGSFGSAAVVHVVDDASRRATHVKLASDPAGDLSMTLAEITRESARAADDGNARADRALWVERLRGEELSRREAERDMLESGADPIHPARVYGELGKRLDRDAVVIGDGGDFVSFAGRLVDSYEPGCWMDPGPYGCLGTGLGYAMAARVAHPDRQVVLMAGDGAFGFCGMDVDSLVRHDLPVVIVVGNNGIWGLEKHPMQALYGYDVAADLQAGCRYDRLAEALGGAGEMVTRPEEVGPALDRALSAGVPYLVNVVTDPAVAYPRSSSLA